MNEQLATTVAVFVFLAAIAVVIAMFLAPLVERVILVVPK